MAIDFLPYGSEVFAAIIILVAALAGRTINFSLKKVMAHVASKTSSQLDDILVSAVRKPILLGVVLFGTYLATGYVRVLESYSAELGIAFPLIFTFYAAFVASMIVKGMLQWYAVEVSKKTKSKADDQFLPIIRKMAYAIILVFAVLSIMGSLGVEITTLVAALGIGGIAIALALQPTLSNLFSGAYIVMDRVVRIGDFVEIDDATKGEIVDISWRSTKIRTFSNNTIIVPNSKMADSVITAYNIPNPEVGFTVSCGVAYGSDLKKVERVTLDVARKIQKMDAAVQTFEPLFRFSEFGDSNINFNAILRAKTRGDSFLMKHEFIKALKERYDKEGITIEWHVSKVYFGDKAFPRKK